MAQTGFTPIQLFRTTTAAAVPTGASLEAGELAINTTDGTLFFKDTGGVVTLLASANGNVTISGVQTLTNKTITGTRETVFAVTGTTPALAGSNGGIQTWTLSGNSTPTNGLVSGDSMTLMIDDGASRTITWPSVVWVGGTAPALAATGFTVVELWRVNAVVYGSLVGNVA